MKGNWRVSRKQVKTLNCGPGCNKNRCTRSAAPMRVKCIGDNLRLSFAPANARTRVRRRWRERPVVVHAAERACHGWHAISRNGGGGEIRTHEGRKPLPVFKTGALNRSATPPNKRESTSIFRASRLAIEALRLRKNTVLPASALPTPGKLLVNKPLDQSFSITGRSYRSK